MTFSFTSIGFKEIKEILNSKDLIFEEKSLAIVLDGEGGLYGEIDQIFLAYSLLFLKKEKELKISITFENLVDSSKFFKFSQQVNQAKSLYSDIISSKNFSVSGSYLDRTTGQVIDVKDYKVLVQSGSFIPPLLIYKSSTQTGRNDIINNSIPRFFKNSIDASKYIERLYFEKNNETINSKFDSKKKNQKKYLAELTSRSKEFSLIKTCLLRVVFETNIFKRKGSIENIDILNTIESFIDNLIIGLEELAKNIIEHSGSEGVITIRKFNKQIFEELKSQKNLSNYLTHFNDIDDFLDINVIDLGRVNIKEHYVKNLEFTKEQFLNSFSSSFKISDEKGLGKSKEYYEKRILETIGIDFNNDIEILSQKDFAFQNFFVRNKVNGVNGLSIQRNKFITKIGLQYFTSIIKDTYNGFIQVSSGKEKTVLYNDDNGESITEFTDDTTFMLSGTYYSCYVPITLTQTKKSIKDIDRSERQEQDPNAFTDLSKYNFIKRDDLIITQYREKANNFVDYDLNSLNSAKKNQHTDKYSLFLNLYLEIFEIQEVLGIKFSKSNDIIAISCKDLQKSAISNGSDWVRFIWTLTNFFENIILYEIDLIHFISIIHLRNQLSQNSNLRFWDEDSAVLFYSKKQHNEAEYYRYGVNILAGENINELAFLNKRIWNHHYSFKLSRLGIGLQEKVIDINSSHLNSAFFTEKGNLRYYETLLHLRTENEDKITIFEKSVQYSLNTLLEKKQNDNTNNRGYKISNTHFRLGSKIHISDFYYAKKIFQNSFFTTPLAYRIAQNIIETYLSSSDIINIKDNSFTIVGYEEYSSFLVSSVRNLLNKLFTIKSNIEINHLIIDKDGDISIDQSKLFNKVLLVVPIASTFNTALKIEDQINDILKKRDEPSNRVNSKVEIIQPSQNVVWVGHRDKDTIIFNNYFDDDGRLIEGEKNIYQKHDWKSVNKTEKCITLERYNVGLDEEKCRVQKYLVPVYTTWYQAKDCDLCYPKVSVNEKCIIETGRASITPQVIFGFPKTKKHHSIIKDKQLFQLSLEGSLLFGHLTKRDNNYLFYTRTGKIVEENEEVIKKWIQQIEDSYKKVFKDQKVVIVTPNTGSKSKFLDLINEYLFEYAANCIVISLKEDYIENSETLYSDGIYSADIVVYVDDVLSTINSFLEVNYIVKYIREKNKSGKGIDYCISLINRMSYENENNLLLKIADLDKFSREKENGDFRNRLIYLQKDYHPNIEEANNQFPLKLEESKYENLEKNSSLDQIRNHFHYKRNNLKQQDLNQTFTEDIKDYSLDFSRERKKRNKKLFQYLVLNAIYRIFEFDATGDLKEYKDERDNDLRMSFSHLTKEFSLNKNIGEQALLYLVGQIDLIFKKDYNHQNIILENINNIDFVIIKVICSTPLIYYKPIRENALNWILIKLEGLLLKIKELNPISDFYKINGNSDYNYYQDLKFLLKKSVKLKSNFIIHKDTLAFFEILIGRLNANSEWNSLKKQNRVFRQELQRFTTNSVFLSNPYIKIKLYDFVQNCLKEGIFHAIVFDKYIVTKNGLFNNLKTCKKIEKEIEKKIHTSLLREFLDYKNSISLKNSNVSSDSKGQLSFNNGDKESYQVRDVVSSEDKDIYENFRTRFENLLLEKPRYKTSTSKNLIVNIVSLVQELTNEHEVKSIKLDEVLNLANKTVCNENGSYNHLLRLLQIENIEIINKYCNDLINKYKYELQDQEEKVFSYETLKNSFVSSTKIKEVLDQDKKYKELCELQNIKEFNHSPASNNNPRSIDSFISLRKYIKNTVESEKEDKIELKMKLISTKIKNILNGEKESNIVEDVFFTVNYKDFDKYEIEDTYTFSLEENSITRKGLIDEEGSLSSLMGNEKFMTSDEHQFSHFEIMKDIDGELICRNDKNIKSLVKKSSQFRLLEDNKSILLVRISDFNNSKKENSTKFITRGVLTVYLNESNRLNEKTLRLLLALRADLLEFIKKKTLGSTFLELLNYETEKNLIKNNSHYLGSFKYSLENILGHLSDYESYKSTRSTKNYSEAEFNKMGKVVVDAIFAQINMIDEKVVKSKKVISGNELKEYIEIILESAYIGKNSFKPDRYEINIPDDQRIEIYTLQYEIILPQLLINIKQYTRNIKNQIKISFTENDSILTLKNKILIPDDSRNRLSKGKQICQNLTKKIYNISHIKLADYISFQECKVNNEFTVKLRIKNEENNNFRGQ